MREVFAKTRNPFSSILYRGSYTSPVAIPCPSIWKSVCFILETGMLTSMVKLLARLKVRTNSLILGTAKSLLYCPEILFLLP